MTPGLVMALPWPPSVNHEWIHARGRAILSPKGREYRTRVRLLAMAKQKEGTFPLEPLEGPLAVRLDLWPPDRRRRDADNYAKAALDALTHAGLWSDDSQIRDLRSVMHEPEKGGLVRLTLSPFGAEDGDV